MRSIFLVKDSGQRIVNGVALSQYHITSVEDRVDFQVGVHGNSRKNAKAPFYPTAKSMLQALKKNIGNAAPSQVYKLVCDQAGCSSQARTPGELPRSQKQVYDLQFRAGQGKDQVDDLLVYMYARKKEEEIVL